MGLRILYYNTAYYSNHGGSIHAKEFYELAQQHPNVDYIELFPNSIHLERNGSSSYSEKLVLAPIISQILCFPRLARISSFHYKLLCNRLSKGDIDVVLVRTGANFLQLPLLRIKFPGIKLAAEINASIFDEYFSYAYPPKLYRLLEAWAYNQCDVSLFVSKHLKESINSCLPPKNRQIIIHNGVNLKRFQPTLEQHEAKRRLQLPDSAKVIGYVGVMDPYRKLPLLIEAFHEVLKTRDECILVIVGDGCEMHSVKQMSEALGLLETGKIRLLGQVPHEEIPKTLEAFDIAIHPAANPYMSPIKLFEYMAMHLPVIGPNIPSISEIFQHGEHLLLTNPEKNSITRLILKLLDDNLLRAKVADQGYKLVTSRYTWNHNVETVIGELNKVVKAKVKFLLVD